VRKLLLNIIQSGTKESSKRFISLFSAFLLAYVVIRYTDENNAIQMAWALITFISTLVGVTVTGEYFNNKKPKEKSEE
jgi:hypothetical protein